jgi:hypothetical protein
VWVLGCVQGPQPLVLRSLVHKLPQSDSGWASHQRISRTPCTLQHAHQYSAVRQTHCVHASRVLQCNVLRGTAQGAMGQNEPRGWHQHTSKDQRCWKQRWLQPINPALQSGSQASCCRPYITAQAGKVRLNTSSSSRAQDALLSTDTAE